MDKLQELIDALNAYISENPSMVSKLEEQIRRVEKHRSDCLIARATGTAVATAGTIAMAFAPITFGVSAIAGAAMVTAGAVTSLVTSIIDTSWTNDFLEDAKSFNTQRERYLTTIENLYQDSAIRKITDGIDKIRALPRYSDSEQGLYLLVGGVSPALLAPAVTATSASGLASTLGAMSTAVKVAQGAVRVVASALGAALVAIEIGVLVNDWQRENPASTYASEVVRLLREEKVSLLVAVEALLLLQTAMRASPNCICREKKLSVFYVNIQSMAVPVSNSEKLNKVRNYIASNQPNIIVFLETWLNSGHNPLVVKSTWNLDAYQLYWYSREEYGHCTVEQERRGGGTLVCWHTGKSQGCTFEPEDFQEDGFQKGFPNECLRFFTITEWSGCLSPSCDKVDFTGIVPKLERTYTFATMYRRGGPFGETKDHPDENSSHFHAQDSNLNTVLKGYFGWGPFRTLSRAGGVLLGDFNWGQAQFAAFGGVVVPELSRIPTTGPTYISGGRATSPDGVFAVPKRLVSSET